MSPRQRAFVGTGGAVLLVITAGQMIVPRILQTNYHALIASGEGVVEESLQPLPVMHLAPPESLKALYMTACVAATPSWRRELKALVEKTELNAIVIDIKDYTGTISFPHNLEKSGSQRGCVVPDLSDFIRELHQAGIYVIGRISVFQDLSYSTLHPELAVQSKSTGGIWKDRKGISFIDVGATPYWEYIVQIGHASYELGFDELNFDYIRYPSDGNMDDVQYNWMVGTSTKPEMLESFFVYLKQQLKDSGAVLSADLFGMTTTVTSDMGIGQILEKALPHFDYVAPMVYPSHYPSGWNGLNNPAEHPYDVIKIAMSEGRRREELFNLSRGVATSTPSKLRPWLQDFNLGATYGVDKVQAQMKATYDSGLSSWMLWSAANRYTEAALLSDRVLQVEQ